MYIANFGVHVAVVPLKYSPVSASHSLCCTRSFQTNAFVTVPIFNSLTQSLQADGFSTTSFVAYTSPLTGMFDTSTLLGSRSFQICRFVSSPFAISRSFPTGTLGTSRSSLAVPTVRQHLSLQLPIYCTCYGFHDTLSSMGMYQKQD